MREASRSESKTQRDSFSALNKPKEQCGNTITKKQKKKHRTEAQVFAEIQTLKLSKGSE